MLFFFFCGLLYHHPLWFSFFSFQALFYYFGCWLVEPFATSQCDDCLHPSKNSAHWKSSLHAGPWDLVMSKRGISPFPALAAG